jgi:hypothetical protein
VAQGGLMGEAVDRVIAALDAAGCRPRRYGTGAVTAHCPGPGHWRGDVNPSLRVGWSEDRALVYCHALCATEDVLTAIGLTPADLFDQPRQRPAGPTRNQLHTAIGRARGLSAADRWVYGWLMWPMNWDGSGVPPRFQPRGQRELAAACGLARMAVQQSVAHLVSHGWLTVTCGREGCERPGLHPGRGHVPVYGFPGIGEDCPGRKCRTRYRPEKAARAANLRLVAGAGAVTAVTLLSVAGRASPPTTTCLQQKPASDLRVHVQSAAIYRPQLQPFTSTWRGTAQASAPQRKDTAS